MNRADQIRLTCVQALEKGLVPAAGGWSKEKAAAMLHVISERPKPALPIGTQPAEVYEAILEILISLEDAEPRYVPKWAKQLLAPNVQGDRKALVASSDAKPIPKEV